MNHRVYIYARGSQAFTSWDKTFQSSASYVSWKRDTARICCCVPCCLPCCTDRSISLRTRRAAIDRYRLPAGPTAANPPHAVATADRWDRQMDGHRAVAQTVAYSASSVEKPAEGQTKRETDRTRNISNKWELTMGRRTGPWVMSHGFHGWLYTVSPKPNW